VKDLQETIEAVLNKQITQSCCWNPAMSKHMWETKSSTDSRSRSNRFLKNRNDSTADWLKASRLFKNKVTELAAAAAAAEMRIKSTLQKGLTGTERQSQPNRRENKTSALFMLLPSMMRLLLHGWQTSRAANQLEKGFTAALERNQTRDQIRYDISRPQGRCLTESRGKYEAVRNRTLTRMILGVEIIFWFISHTLP
jgi:hypothetical protein